VARPQKQRSSKADRMTEGKGQAERKKRKKEERTKDDWGGKESVKLQLPLGTSGLNIEEESLLPKEMSGFGAKNKVRERDLSRGGNYGEGSNTESGRLHPSAKGENP